MGEIAREARNSSTSCHPQETNSGRTHPTTTHTHLESKEHGYQAEQGDRQLREQNRDWREDPLTAIPVDALGGGSGQIYRPADDHDDPVGKDEPCNMQNAREEQKKVKTAVPCLQQPRRGRLACVHRAR